MCVALDDEASTDVAVLRGKTVEVEFVAEQIIASVACVMGRNHRYRHQECSRHASATRTRAHPSALSPPVAFNSVGLVIGWMGKRSVDNPAL